MQRMAKMAVSEARERLPEATELARSEAVFLERYGKPGAVLVSPDRYNELWRHLRMPRMWQRLMKR